MADLGNSTKSGPGGQNWGFFEIVSQTLLAFIVENNKIRSIFGGGEFWAPGSILGRKVAVLGSKTGSISRSKKGGFRGLKKVDFGGRKVVVFGC